MKRLVTILCLPLVLLPAATSISQSEQKTEAVETEKSTAAIGESAKKKPKSKSDGKNKKDAPEIFIPSEEISEDLSVSFPVDI
ncbi:MAG: hypothetical protein ACR2P1_11560 [Pseudomonadales bacterium]